MGSVISTIYTNIAAMAVTADSITPVVYGLADAPSSPNAGDLPMRILQALSGGLQGQEMAWETISGTGGATNNQQNINWQIEDLMLWLPVGMGEGPKGVMPALVEYAGAYIDKVRTNRTIATRASVTNLSVDVGIYTFPMSQQATAYFGCMAKWTIKELP